MNFGYKYYVYSEKNDYGKYAYSMSQAKGYWDDFMKHRATDDAVIIDVGLGPHKGEVYDPREPRLFNRRR